jgi:hypothetical protein
MRGEVDFLLNDGMPLPALEVLKLVAPSMRVGAAVVTDNAGVFKADYREYVAWARDARNGFASTMLPFRSGAEYSVKLR